MKGGSQARPAPYAGYRALAISSLALAVSSACMLAFRGPTSIASALVVPSVLVLLLGKVAVAYRVAAYAAFLIVAMLLFQTQVVFVFGYISLSLAFSATFGDRSSKASGRNLRFIASIWLVALVLFVCIALTEAVLGVPLHSMMMRLSRQNPAIYAGVLLLEAILVSAANMLLIRSVSSRLRI